MTDDATDEKRDREPDLGSEATLAAAGSAPPPMTSGSEATLAAAGSAPPPTTSGSEATLSAAGSAPPPTTSGSEAPAATADSAPPAVLAGPRGTRVAARPPASAPGWADVPDDPGAGQRTDLTGHTLAGRYSVLERIGTGGMSVVYLARHELLKKKVALKVLRAEQAIRRDGQARFHREARAAASIGDPHVVDITDYGFTERGDAFIVMELLEGRNLRQTIVAEGPLPAGRTVAIARQILRALGAAHEKGIIHRDLKAENVFLCRRDGQDFIKLLDFGISKITRPLDDEGDATGVTTTGQVLGTPQYLAPEQAHGIDTVDHRADIYAMGVICYEMLTGQLPFTGKSVLEVVMKHVQEQPQPPRERNPDLEIPLELEQVVLVAMAKDPDHRYQSAQAMLDALPCSSALPGGFSSRSLPPVSRAHAAARRLAIPVAAAAAVILALGAFMWWRQPDPAPQATTRPDPVAVTATAETADLTAAPPPADARAPDLQARVSLEVRASPSHAEILVDGRPLGRGRAATSVPRGADVVIEARARGFRSYRKQLTVDRAAVISARLRRTGRSRTRNKRGPADLQKNPYR